MTDWIIPFLCGLGASILSAWGVGGGTLLLLVMTLFLDVDQRTAQGIILLFFLPTAASALACHARGGYLDKPTLKSAVPLAVAAALAGQATPPRPPLASRVDTAVEQFRLAEQDKGEHIACLEARKHFAWYLRGVPYSGYYKEKISHISTMADILDIAAGVKRDLR